MKTSNCCNSNIENDTISNFRVVCTKCKKYCYVIEDGINSVTGNKFIEHTTKPNHAIIVQSLNNEK